jgi:hypothetical protein
MPWRRLKKDFSNTCPNLKHTPIGLSHGAKITNHRSHATSYSKMMTAQDKIRQHFQLKKVITTTLFLVQKT